MVEFCGGSGSARRAVLLILRTNRITRRAPLLVAPFAQIVEPARRHQMLRAIDRDGLAVEPLAARREQECREILQFFHLPEAAHRIDLAGVRTGLFART